MHKIPSLLIVIVAVALLPAASAFASATLDQYQENVPSATGGKKKSGDGKGGSSGSQATTEAEPSVAAPPVTEPTRTVTPADKAGGPGKSKKKKKKSKTSDNQINDPGNEATSADIETLASSLGGAGGIGLVVPILIGLSLLVAIAIAVNRARGGRVRLDKS